MSIDAAPTGASNPNVITPAQETANPALTTPVVDNPQPNPQTNADTDQGNNVDTTPATQDLGPVLGPEPPPTPTVEHTPPTEQERAPYRTQEYMQVGKTSLERAINKGNAKLPVIAALRTLRNLNSPDQFTQALHNLSQLDDSEISPQSKAAVTQGLLPIEGKPINCWVEVTEANGQKNQKSVSVISISGADSQHFTCQSDAGVTYEIPRENLILAQAIAEKKSLVENVNAGEQKIIEGYLTRKEQELKGEKSAELDASADQDIASASVSLGVMTAKDVLTGADTLFKHKKLTAEEQALLKEKLKGRIALDPQTAAEMVLEISSPARVQANLMVEKGQLNIAIETLKTQIAQTSDASIKAQYEQMLANKHLELTALNLQFEQSKKITTNPQELAKIIQNSYEGLKNGVLDIDPHHLNYAVSTGEPQHIINAILSGIDDKNPEKAGWTEQLLKAAKYGGIAMVIVVAVAIITAQNGQH